MKISSVLLATMLLGLTLPVRALEFLPDPTRPAVDLRVLGAGGGSGETAVPVDASTVAAEGVQAVIISPNYRGAIINGKQVELGGKVGGAKLIEVNERGVVLQGARGKQVMELFSTVNIKKHAEQGPVVESKSKPEPGDKKTDEQGKAQSGLPKDEGVSK